MLAETVTTLLDRYGYGVVALGVGVESTGIPFPGETILVAAALYGGHGHRLELVPLIAAAAAGAIIGDNLGFLVGRRVGFKVVRRYGARLGLHERRLKLGVYLFRRYGVLVVFFGRFISILRTWAALLAGTNRMPWGRFLAANAAGAIAWASIVGGSAYSFGEAAAKLAGRASAVALVVVAVLLGVGVWVFRGREASLLDEAERALPGPIDSLDDRGG